MDYPIGLPTLVLSAIKGSLDPVYAITRIRIRSKCGGCLYRRYLMPILRYYHLLISFALRLLMLLSWAFPCFVHLFLNWDLFRARKFGIYSSSTTSGNHFPFRCINFIFIVPNLIRAFLISLAASRLLFKKGLKSFCIEIVQPPAVRSFSLSK